MSHKTLVNGTVYEVDGGKTLIDGVAYSIDKGKTLVGGTAYEVGFDDGMRTVTLTGICQNQAYGYLEVDGKKYYRTLYNNLPDPMATDQYTFPVGTQIRFVAKARCDLATSVNATIKLNGQDVVLKTATKGNGEVTATYDYVLTGNITVMLSVTYLSMGTGANAVTTISITEE